MPVGCFAGLVIGPDKIAISVASIALAVLLLVLVSRTRNTTARIGMMYGHLTALFFPLVLLTTNIACGAMCMAYCYNDTAATIAYALPGTLLLGTLAGFVVIPMFYMRFGKPGGNREINVFIKKHAANMRIKAPKFYVIDKAKPMAFSFRSFRSAIFMSVGMFDILNRKEIHAVLLHELAHIKQRSSALKVSLSILRVLSPLSILAKFDRYNGKEEKDADSFAARAQRTDKYIRSARKKINSTDAELC